MELTEEEKYKSQLEQIFKSSIRNYERRNFLIQKALQYLNEDIKWVEKSRWSHSFAELKASFKIRSEILINRFEELKISCSEFECVTFYKKTEKMRETEAGKSFTELLLANYASGYAHEAMRRYQKKEEGASYSGKPFYEKHNGLALKRFMPWLNNEAKQFKRCRTTKDIRDVLDGKDISKKHYFFPCFFKLNNKNSPFQIATLESYKANIPRLLPTAHRLTPVTPPESLSYTRTYY